MSQGWTPGQEVRAEARPPPGTSGTGQVPPWDVGAGLRFEREPLWLLWSVSTVLGRLPWNHVSYRRTLPLWIPATLCSLSGLGMGQASKNQGSAQEQSDPTSWRWKMDPPFPLVTVTHMNQPCQSRGSVESEVNFF